MSKIVILGHESDFFAQQLTSLCDKYMPQMKIRYWDTKEDFVADIVSDLSVKIVFAPYMYTFSSIVKKYLSKIRSKRKDIFLVLFHQSQYADLQYESALKICKEASANLVFSGFQGHDSLYMVVAPEESCYHVTSNSSSTLNGLVEMVMLRSQLKFTRSNVVDGEPIPWTSDLVYPSLREVVDYCIDHEAYKTFGTATAGHFACKLDDHTFLTSIRKTNFNQLYEVGLVKVVTDGVDNVIAYGAKPSVGGQSQRIVFHAHPEYDCIVHFHCPIKADSWVPTVSQRPFECGSHQCGQNTSDNLQVFGNLSAVYLNNHGPNIVFHHSIDPQEVITFIENNFDLKSKTGDYLHLGTANSFGQLYDKFE